MTTISSENVGIAGLPLSAADGPQGRGAGVSRGELALLLVLGLAVEFGGWYLAAGRVGGTVEEGGWLENVQSGLLAAGVMAGLLGAMRAGATARRWWGVFLAVMTLLAFAREADLMIVLNPRYLGEWGVRYRLDWWTSGRVPIGLKLGWLVVFAVAATVVIYPAVKARTFVGRRSAARDRVLKLLGGATGFYFLGYAADDLVGRGMLISPGVMMYFEEGAEAIGAALLACAGAGKAEQVPGTE